MLQSTRHEGTGGPSHLAAVIAASIAVNQRAAHPSYDRLVATIIVYEKPTCTTCRKLRELLDGRGIDFESIDYHVTGIEQDELRELLRKMGCRPREVLRMREPLVKELELERSETSDDELIAQISANPPLLQRPIVVRGERALLARPVERALELL